MKKVFGAVLVGGLSVASSASALAQQAPPASKPPAPAAQESNGSSVPEVEVQQEQSPTPAPKPAAANPKPKPKSQPQAAPASEPALLPPPVATAPPQPFNPASVLPNSPYGSPAARGAAARAEQSATTPVNPTQLIPSNLEGFSGAATNVTPEMLAEQQPRNINEALVRVPGVTIINDDANAQHGGVSVRGSPARRSRKVLVMEDGHANNLALWLDPSVHYWGPIERFESVEVLRGTVITHGPNNNFGVVNARNLSPFGLSETVVSGAIGFTETDRGFFINEDDEVIEGDDQVDMSYRWHVHTRQLVDNVGLVLSYTGANVQGAWDTETLRFNDFYGSLGFKGSDSDLVVTASYARQRDNYDEQNFLGERDLGVLPGFTPADGDEDEAAEIAEELFAAVNAGFAEQQFENLKHCKTCYAGAAGLNTYAGDIWRGQIVHNAYIDDDTTLTTRVYAGYHQRDRYQLNTFESAPDGSASGAAPVFDPAAPTDPDEESEIFFGEDTMFGRLRTFRHVGGEVRAEWANRNILGFNQDIQAGVRYEYQDMTNRNFIGRDDEILKAGDEAGATIFDRELDANAVSAFLQTNVKVATDFNVVPGIRFEWYQVSRTNRVVAREESEAGGADACPPPFVGDECLSVDGIVLNPDPSAESFDNFNALPGVSFAYTGFNLTTVFGGYHRGMSTGVLRNEDFPVEDEIGDNFNLGFRSNAIRGLDFEAVGFYQLLENYQFGASFSDTSDRSFGRADEVSIYGVELLGRLNSQPYTGGSLNFFGEANYLYTRGEFEDLTTPDGEDLSGNRIPEVPLHVAALTLGVQQTTGWRWDASVTATYRSAFFTDEGNTPFGFGGEFECEDNGANQFECELEEAGEDGEVPSVWLLSARANLALGNSGASLWVSGDNLTNEFYISDREDGMKPGLGRTFWTGFRYQF
jgi:Fe(3+) dicitrate transport protein